MTRKFITIAIIALLGTDVVFAVETEVKGSKDFPGIGRFANSVITGYEVKDFDETKIQAAVFKDGKPSDQRKLEVV